MNQYPDDTFLARWLAGTLSAEEKEAFAQSADFQRLKLLMDASQKLDVESYDTASALNDVKNRLSGEHKKRKTVRLIGGRRWLIAASILVFVSTIIWWLIPSSSQTNQIQLTALPGEKKEATLSDGTYVILNAGSELQADIADTARTVRLTGEAYLDVAAGVAFRVETELGEVSVLGTSFNVFAREQLFQVSCYEGIVKVQTSQEKADTLRAGESISYRIDASGEKNKSRNTATAASWKDGLSSLTKVPMKEVIAELERQFDVEIRTVGLDLDEIVSAHFPHDNLSLALQTCLGDKQYHWKQTAAGIFEIRLR
ncbi:MAG: FecR domain-containing protein [Bacteroidota bacterium]